MTFAAYLDAVIASAALCREIDKRESAALDALPHELPAYGPWCADYGRGRDPNDSAYHATLAQLGLELGEDGRMRARRPLPCGHRPWERNVGRDQLTCDGCQTHTRDHEERAA